MKRLSLIALVCWVVGCSTTPRVGDVSGADYPVVISSSASDGLKMLANTPITGVRDVSQSEFYAVSGDVEKFDSLAEARNGGLDPNLYAATSAAAGVSLGLALDYASGLAILGRLAADNREFNYDFSGDFRSNPTVFSPVGKDVFLENLAESIPQAMVSFNKTMEELFKVSVNSKPVITQAKDVYGYRAYSKIPVGENKSALVMFMFHVHCPTDIDSGVICDTTVRYWIDRKAHPAVSMLAYEVSRVLPEGSVMYMPPRKDLYQLPMVYDTSGEPMILVQSRN